MQSTSLSEDGRALQQALNALQPHTAAVGDTLHVQGVGGRLYFAYEQLRNAAEYSEQHLLLRRAIERFLWRSLTFRQFHRMGEELVIELTQSRYLQNDAISQHTIKQIDDALREFLSLYRPAGTKAQAGEATVRTWIVQTASVHIEQLLVPRPRVQVFTDFAYQHYLNGVHSPEKEELHPHSYQVAMYCAMHRAILKSDLATIRAYALSSQIVDSEDNGESIDYFVYVNELIDQYYQDRSTNRLVRLISQHGAPMRVLREIVFTNTQAGELVAQRSTFLSRVRQVTEEQYALVRTRLNQGIARSVAFVAITKILIGVGLEVPYDLVRHGQIVWPPLVLNILFPPLYMATLGLGIRPPSRNNTDLVVAAIDRILYGDKPVTYRLRRRVTSPALNNTFNALYGLTFLALMIGLGYLLHALGFTLVSGIIFFVFLSTVSFLGFRLTQTAREFEMVETRRGVGNLIGDLLYTPFIRIGYWLADKYSRINVVARILDILIEMPLKFVLRFVQQWVGFLRDKQEEL
jgi:hypothetical protein